LVAPAAQSTYCVLEPEHEPRQPLHERVCVCVPYPHDVLQPPELTQPPHDFCAPSEQETLRELEPEHEPKQPRHLRDCACVPVPHDVLQLPTSYQPPQYLATPSEQETLCELEPEHEPTQPRHERDWACVPVPHDVLQPPTSYQPPQYLLMPAVQETHRSSLPMPKLHPPKQKLQLRVWRCVPVPHDVLQPPTFPQLFQLAGQRQVPASTLATFEQQRQRFLLANTHFF
jgi:hypothetical protein